MKGVQKGRVMFGEPAGAMREGFEAIMAHNIDIHPGKVISASLSFISFGFSPHLMVSRSRHSNIKGGRMIVLKF